MTTSDTVFDLPDALREIAETMHGGDIRKAKWQVSKALSQSDAQGLTIVKRVMSTLAAYPFNIAVSRLVQARMNMTDEFDRAVIDACMPENDPHIYQPQDQRAPAWTGQNKHQAPSTVTVKTRHDLQRRKVSRQEHDARAVAAAYQAENAGVPDGPQLPNPSDLPPTPYASELDYDKAAVPGTRNVGCLGCWQECERGAAHRRGLCVTCEKDGLPGYGQLPKKATPADHVAARCAYIVEHNPNAAYDLLILWYRQCGNEGVQAMITEWVHANPLPKPITTPQPETSQTEQAQPVAQAEPPAALPAATPPAPQTPEVPPTTEPAQAPAAPAARTRTTKRRRLNAAEKAALKATRATNALGDCATCTAPRKPRDVRGITTDDHQCASCRELVDVYTDTELDTETDRSVDVDAIDEHTGTMTLAVA